MTELMNYADHVHAMLEVERHQAANRLQHIMDALPEKTLKIALGIHPDQDGEGYVTLMVHLEGPDVSVLNGAIAQWRTLFDGFIPLLLEGHADINAANGEDAEFIAGDILVDSAADWLEAMWRAEQSSATDLPVSIFCAEAFGTRVPRSVT
ncbi:MAG: DUF6389 family protein [Pseudomonadota bacterium]